MGAPQKTIGPPIQAAGTHVSQPLAAGMGASTTGVGADRNGREETLPRCGLTVQAAGASNAES
jgi:hypothetical protein